MRTLSEVPAGAWDELLAEVGCGDVYLRRDYVAAACLLEEGEPVLLHLGDPGGHVVFACIVRTLPGSESCDVTTPYGYGGPVLAGHEAAAGRFYEHYGSWCQGRGIVSTFIRFHPLYANHRYAAAPVHAERAGLTVGWRLGDGRDLLASMHAKHRNTCRKAIRAGVRVEATKAPETLAEFATLYELTMQRQEASSFYFFPDAFWRHLEASLRDRLVLFEATVEGGVVASALCLLGDDWLHYFLGATHDDARELGASNLLLYEAASWGREQGFSLFHLGGGVGGRDDSLLAFKRRFSPDDACEFWIGKAVHDPGAYARLTGCAEIDVGGFFPAYRVPGALSQTAGTPRSR